MEWTEVKLSEIKVDFENRFKRMYETVIQRDVVWFEYKQGKYFELVLLNVKKGNPFFVIADGHLLQDGTMLSTDDSDGFYIKDYEDVERLFQDLAAEVDRWKTLDDD